MQAYLIWVRNIAVLKQYIKYIFILTGSSQSVESRGAQTENEEKISHKFQKKRLRGLGGNHGLTLSLSNARL